MKRLTCILLSASALCLGQLAHAAPLGTAFTYQGRLDQNNRPALDGLYQMNASLFSSPSLPGASLASQPGLLVPVTNGLFTVDLDFGAFTGEERWLEIAVRTNNNALPFNVLAPRTRLAPTPNALYASTAGTASQLKTAGAPSAGQFLSYNGSSLLWQTPPTGLWQASGSTAYYTAGNVGIGTIAPLHPLTVGVPETPINLPSLAGFYRAGGAYLTARDTTRHVEALLGADSTAIVAAMTDHPLTFRAGNGEGSGNTEYMRIERGGTVGIGTTTPSPSYKLDVAGNAQVRDTLRVHGLELTAAPTEDELGGLTIRGAAPPFLQAPIRFTVQRNGFVGIRTGNPQSTLDVHGDIAWGTSRLTLDQSGSIELGDSLSSGTVPYIDFHYGVGGEQDFNVRLINDSDRLLTLGGNFLRVNGAGGEQAYIGGDGAGGDVQVGSLNPAVVNVALYNQASGTYMNLGCRDISTRVLTITGGADLAEPFPMKEEAIEKGSVVVIDDEHPGQLKMSTRAYDTQVAGIVSGANGIHPGISLKQEGALDQGQNVALTGRVYVQADASFGAIKPGDLLTTSDTPGHAMKVTDHARAQGAILGKAMTSLKEGKGFVQVLVSLQ